ncbi:hypothetical protein LEMLEM_LOCUS6865 [Lemmus lemmus]
MKERSLGWVEPGEAETEARGMKEPGLRATNVCHEEFDVPAAFPVDLKRISRTLPPAPTNKE